MILSDKDIKKYIKQEKLIIDPLKEENIGAASIDLRLGNEIKKYNYSLIKSIDPKIKIDTNYFETRNIQDIAYVLYPGEFVLATTLEYVSIPDFLVATVEGRSSYGRYGLTVHVTAGYIDPGFEGQITLEMYNHNKCTILLHSGTEICQLALHKLSNKCEVPYHSKKSAKYCNQVGPTESKSYRDFKKEE